MTTGAKPFHHGNLRAVLLDRAEHSLREHGADALSLRQLAREAGVSHGAPRHHFPDRRALLDALAERGFQRLTEAMDVAVAEARPAVEAGARPAVGVEGAAAGRLTGERDRAEQWRATAAAWVRFAIENAALVDLMFTAIKPDDAPDGLRAEAGRFFALVGELIDVPPRRQLLLIATLQGIATLVTSGRIRPEQTGELVEDAVALHLGVSPDGLEPSSRRV